MIFMADLRANSLSNSINCHEIIYQFSLEMTIAFIFGLLSMYGPIHRIDLYFQTKLAISIMASTIP